MMISALVGFATGMIFYHYIVSPMVSESPDKIEISVYATHEKTPDIVQENPHAGRESAKSRHMSPSFTPEDQSLPSTDTKAENTHEDIDTAYESLISRARKDSFDLFDLFKEFESQQTSYEWGQNYQQKITEFISLHELSYSVAINTILCKSSICELSVTIYEPSPWSSLLGEMWGQEWWNFSIGEHESIDNDVKQESYSYYLFKEVYVH